ncbi:MAG: DUF3857 domain-containing protein, partial [candidate division Zixibacteria bacterium]|nr:DUF3857 domain-containing protein [candidate division Zixibacteria bacterium]
MSYQTHTVSRSIFLIMLLLSAAVFADDKPKFGNVPDGEWAIGVPQDYADANAVVVFNNGHLTVTTDNITIEMHVRIKVLTTAGIDEVGDRSVWYNKKYDKLKGFKAHTITPDGKKHKVEKEAIFEKTSGNVVDMTFSFPTVSPGCIVEYCYRVVSERFRYLRPWYFQTDLYTLHSEFAVSLPNGFTYNIQDFNIPANCKEPVVTEQADITKNLSSGARIRTFTWTLENLPPVTEEPYMSAENDYRSALRFQLATYEDPYSHIVFQKTWSELGKLEQEWFDEYCNKRKDITKLADSVTAGLVDPRAKSRKLTAFVQTGYTTSDEYLHGFFHHEKIETLLAERMGTGEGKNLLLVELHKAAGLSAWPVLISRRDHGRLVAGNPDLQQFDYMIAVVQFDDGWEFLDASNRLNPYGLLPPDCLCGAGLLVDGEQSELVRITQKSVMSSRTDKSLLRVAADGNVSCSTSSCFTGYYAAMYTRRHDRQAEKDF